MNVSLLKDKDYVEVINKLLDIELEQVYASKKDHWEIIKLAIASTTIQFLARRKKSDVNKLKVLEKKLAYWEGERDASGFFEKQESHIRKLRSEIKEINHKKTQGAVLRCRANWEEFAEKPTKYFLNLEKANFNKKTILRLETEEGQIINEEKQILTEMNQFYEKLYRKRPVQIDDNYVRDCDYPQPDEQERSNLNAPVELLELGLAVKSLKNNKAPGTNGIPIDFYKMFWKKLKLFFLELIKEIMQEGQFHLSARRGIITLLEKLGKNPLFLAN